METQLETQTRKVRAAELHTFAMQVLSQDLPELGNTHRTVIWLRYGLGLSQVETGERMCLCHQRVSQIEATAMRILRKLVKEI